MPITNKVVSSNLIRGHSVVSSTPLDTTLCDKVRQRLAADRGFSSGTPVSSTNKTDRHYIVEILLKKVLNTIKPNQVALLKYIYH